jgi:hypothetical protein
MRDATTGWIISVDNLRWERPFYGCSVEVCWIVLGKLAECSAGLDRDDLHGLDT